MTRLIDADELLKHSSKVVEYDEAGFSMEYNAVSIEEIKEAPKVGEWIPIGQYPSEPSLLCFEDGSMVVGYYDYDDDRWAVCTSDIFETDLLEDDCEHEIVACMPLPEPYKEGDT